MAQKLKGLVFTQDKIPKELFNAEYCYDCKQLSIMKPAQFIAVKCFTEGVSIDTYNVYSLNT